jgi:type IV secretory pathway protease TraF
VTRPVVSLVAGGAVATVAGAGLLSGRAPPLLINESASVPRGVYLRTDLPIAAGRLVTLTPPPPARAYLATLGAGPEARLLKRVAATEGDVACSGGGRLTWRRGQAVALTTDRRGTRLPVWRGCRRLACGEVLVIGDTATSFDSRYFGPVRSSEIRGVYREVWRW